MTTEQNGIETAIKEEYYELIRPYVDPNTLGTTASEIAEYTTLELVARSIIDTFVAQGFYNKKVNIVGTGNGSDYFPLWEKSYRVFKVYENNELAYDRSTPDTNKYEYVITADKTAIQKVYPGATILQYNLAGLEPGQPLIQVSDKSKNYLLNNKTIGEETEVSEVVYESGDYWHPDPKKDSAISGVGNKMRSREDRGQDTSAQTKPDYSNRLKPGETYMQFSKRKQAERTQKEEVAAWQRKEGKNQKGGLNEKGRKSYERENPGSDLKAPQPEGGSRRDSFCARMKGMKKKLTSAKTANDPDSRINKSLRAWNC